MSESLEQLLSADPREASTTSLLPALNGLTAHHYANCGEYTRMMDAVYGGSRDAGRLEDVPYVPVGVFKRLELRSIDREAIHRVLRSSGTTSGETSRIFLDRETARLQTMALASIMTRLLGRTRRPMLVVDTPDVLDGRADYSARTAAVLGMMPFGRRPAYALTKDFTADRVALRSWQDGAGENPTFVFGFTYLLWRLMHELDPGELDLSAAVVLHGGGWKRLEAEAVNRDAFNEMLHRRTGVTRVHNYYGFIEQVGSIFVDCEHGYFHCPPFAEVLVRRPEDRRVAPVGERGVLQVMSAIPRSYPGHSILTEDLATIDGVDDCPCGRPGTRFVIHGRVPRTIARGCSDTRATA